MWDYYIDWSNAGNISVIAQKNNDTGDVVMQSMQKSIDAFGDPILLLDGNKDKFIVNRWNARS